jgi:hypothetical protein
MIKPIHNNEKICQKLHTLPRGKKICLGLYWCCSTSSTNILVLRPQTFYNIKNFSNFLNVCSANISVLTGLQHQYIGAVQGESKCLQHHAYSVKRCLFSQLEFAEVEIELFQDGGQIKNKKNINHHNGS